MALLRRSYGGQSHRGRFRKLGVDRFLQPALELLQGIARCRRLVQGGERIVAAQVGNGKHAMSLKENRAHASTSTRRSTHGRDAVTLLA